MTQETEKRIALRAAEISRMEGISATGALSIARKELRALPGMYPAEEVILCG